MDRRGAGQPGAVVVPLGVGALAACAGDFFRVERYPEELGLVGVEPVESPCFVESSAAGRRVAMADPAPSVMDGLARGLPSPLAWDVVSTTFDAYVAIDDARAEQAVHLLAAHGVTASAAGAASLGGLLDLDLGLRRDLLPEGASVLVVVTEAPLP